MLFKLIFVLLVGFVFTVIIIPFKLFFHAGLKFKNISNNKSKCPIYYSVVVPSRSDRDVICILLGKVNILITFFSVFLMFQK